MSAPPLSALKSIFERTVSDYSYEISPCSTLSECSGSRCAAPLLLEQAARSYRRFVVALCLR